MNSLTLTVGVSLSEERLDPAGLLLGVAGELDIATVPALRERLNHALESGVRKIVVDLRDVTFMDSVALAVMVHTCRELEPDGRLVMVMDPASYTRLILAAAGLDACLDLAETRAEALALIAS
jgi:anti-anti-sigma factor